MNRAPELVTQPLRRTPWESLRTEYRQEPGWAALADGVNMDAPPYIPAGGTRGWGGFTGTFYYLDATVARA